MKRRNLYDIIEAAEKTKAARKAEKDAAQAKWDKELQTLVRYRATPSVNVFNWYVLYLASPGIVSSSVY